MENVKFIPTNCFYKNPVGAVLKNSKMAGVLKGIKVKPKTAG